MKRVMTRWKRAGAFTLIEMLTVIAIIGILAALLLPAIRLAMRKAKEAVARADIAGLTTALSQYSSDFGALPPDRTNDNEPNAAGDLTCSEANFGDADSPNECLVWFLTREYVTNADGAGRPWATGSGWNPDASTTVFARASGGRTSV